MADSPFQTAAKAALAAFQYAGGEEVEYEHGSTSCSPTVIRNRFAADVPDSQGVYMRVDKLEFIIKQADLEFGAGPVEPERGDVITDADGKKYDVQDGYEPLEQSGEWRIPVVEVDA